MAGPRAATTASTKPSQPEGAVPGQIEQVRWAEARKGASKEAAAATAAVAVLGGSHPASEAEFQKCLDAYLAALPKGSPKSDGIKVGRIVASTVLESRKNDGANSPSRRCSRASDPRHRRAGFRARHRSAPDPGHRRLTPTLAQAEQNGSGLSPSAMAPIADPYVPNSGRRAGRPRS
jgi:hypothetical protein